MTSVGKKMASRLKRFAESLEAGEVIEERFTCRTIKLNLEPQPCSASLVKEARKTLNASQAIFAQFLGVSLSTVRDWEQGKSPCRGSACRMMFEIKRDPEYWIGRLKELAQAVDRGLELSHFRGENAPPL